MTSISAVEVVQNESRLRVNVQLQVEKEIMGENSKRFILAYKSPLFSYKVIKKIEMFREIKESQNLLLYVTSIKNINHNISNFLQFL